MNLGQDVFMSNIDRHPAAREGITCIVCHRLDQSYGKLSGRLHVKKGSITEPIYGPLGDSAELDNAISKDGLVIDNDKAGRKVHDELEALPSAAKPIVPSVVRLATRCLSIPI
ncbi:MAG: hypothetical protein ACJAVI_001154 [Candidatus Azotimanducaceae bacterium]|jgi:hypothetical protein